MAAVTDLAGRYDLGEQLGRGATGVVLAAHDRVLSRHVAVKVLDIAGAPERSVARFRREAQYLAGLTHPNVVTVYDFGLDDDRAWLVMERLPGPTLAELVGRRGPLAVATVAAYGRQCAAALAAAHAAGIVHRDVKPANLMLAADGACKLLDLGIARLADAAHTSQTLTQAGMIMGTVPFLAPEVITGAAATPAADIYALGAVLFTLLTGRPPYDADTQIATLAQHVNAPVPRVLAYRPDVPAGLDELLVDQLAKMPGARPDAVQVEQRLAALTESPRAPTTVTLPAAATVASPPTAVLPTPDAVAGDSPQARHRDRRLLLAAAIAAATLVAAVVALASAQGHHPAAAAHAPPRTAASAAPSSASPPPTSTAAPGVALADAVASAVAAGQIDPSVAPDLENRAGELAAAFTTGAPDAAHRADDFSHRLSELANHGQITQAGYANIAAALQQLTGARTGPADGGDGGD